MSGPLNGLKVIEFAGLGPAPLAGQLLADQGAKVTVIDRKSGLDHAKEPNRRGKRSIALNLKNEETISLVLKLIKSSDVLIEGFRPGVMERLGLGPKPCMDANPGLVYGRITGWGQDGPVSQTAGHDLNYLAVTGALHAMGEKGKPPMPPLNLVADYGGGTMFLLFGLMSAIYQRNNTGKGAVVDAAMIEGVVAMMGLQHGMMAQGLWKDEREVNFLDGSAPFYRCYKCKDGKFISVGCLEPQFFAEFLKLAELPSELSKSQMDNSRWAETCEMFVSHFAQKTRDEWQEIFEGSDACVAPVLNFDEAEQWPHNKARGLYIDVDGLRQSGVAPKITGENSSKGKLAPGVNSGANTMQVMSELGYDDTQIDKFRTLGVFT